MSDDGQFFKFNIATQDQPSKNRTPSSTPGRPESIVFPSVARLSCCAPKGEQTTIVWFWWPGGVQVTRRCGSFNWASGVQRLKSGFSACGVPGTLTRDGLAQVHRPRPEQSRPFLGWEFRSSIEAMTRRGHLQQATNRLSTWLPSRAYNFGANSCSAPFKRGFIAVLCTVNVFSRGWG